MAGVCSSKKSKRLIKIKTSQSLFRVSMRVGGSGIRGRYMGDSLTKMG